MKAQYLARHPALEAVQHQYNTILFKALALEFDQVLQLSEPSKKDVESLPISDLVFKHTGMKIKFVCEPYHGFNAYVSVPHINKNHALLKDWRKEFFTNDDAIRAPRQLKTNKLTGFVDRKRGRVSGVFSQLEATIGINLGMFYQYQSYRMTGNEIAATILHEMGHLFGWYELLANTLTTNQALRAVKESFLGTNDKKLKIEILNELDAALSTTISDKDSVAETATTEDSLMAVILKANVEHSRSELGSNIYDRRGFEYLADQFATRFGAGVHLVTSMDKANKLYGHESYNGYVTHLFAQLSSTIGFVLGSVFSIGLWPILLLMFGDPILHGETDGYDRPGERFARIRRELNDALKRRDIAKELKEQILADIETIKKIESEVTDRWSWGTKLYGFIFPSARKARNKIAQQQLLEELANNSLYAAAARLSTLA